MKIGIVLSRPPGYSETFFKSKISGLIEKGFTVKLFVDIEDKTFTLCPQNALPGNNLLLASLKLLSVLFKYPGRIFRFIKNEYRDHKSLKTVAKNLYINLHLLEAKDLDWVHFGFATLAIGRENIANIINAKMGVSIRGFDISIYPLKHLNCYKLLWKNAKLLHTISDDLLKVAYKHGMPSNLKSIKINPAIDIIKFQRSIPVTDFNSRSSFKFLTVSRLHWKKGLEYTLQTMAILNERGIDFHYTIAGDGTELERLMLAVYQLGLIGKVTFAGKVDNENIKILYEKSDLYIQYSIQEGFCNSVLEAQLMGLLCVVSDAEGLSENVLHEETGWVVPKREPELLAKKIIEVIKLSDNEKNRIRNNAINRVQEEFNLEKQQAAFAAFFNNHNL